MLRLHAAQQGFTLVEVMVAFVILALTSGVVTVVFSNGLRVVADADGYTRAIAVAESKLAEFSVPSKLVPGPAQGIAGDVQWKTVVIPGYLEPVAPERARAIPPDFFRVKVQTSWGDSRTIVLETMRLVPTIQPPGAAAKNDSADGKDESKNDEDQEGEDSEGDTESSDDGEE